MHNRRPPQSKRKQRGFTLIEGLVALIIMALVIAAASGRIGNIFGKNEATEEIANLNNLIVNTKTLRSNTGYGANTNLVTSLIATEGVPKGMPVVGGLIKNAWGQNVTVAGTADGLGFVVTTNDVPKAACIDLATKVSRGGAVKTKVGSATEVSGEVAVTTATTDCSATANDVAFTITN